MSKQFQRRLAATVSAMLIVVVASLSAVMVPVGPATAAEPTSPEPKGWILVDAGTGNVLNGREIHTPLPTASIAKIVTAMTALDHLPNDAKIPITQDVVNHRSGNIQASGMALGQSWSMSASLGVMLVISANDAAYAIAEAVTPKASDFGALELATAQRLGMKDSTFNDPAGLDDSTSIGGGPTMSPYDIAIAARNARSVPPISHWLSMPQYSFTDPAGVAHNLINHNSLLKGLPSAYDGADAGKTGSTKKAGKTLVATATRNGRTLIAVILNTEDRYGWAKKIFDEGFATALGSTGTSHEALPPVAYRSLSQRQVERRNFIALVQRPSLSGAAGVTTTKPTQYKSTTTAGHSTSTTGAAKSSDGSSNSSSIILVFLAGIGGLFFARRAQIKRRRTRRMAKRRSTQAAMRRGSLPVVDGKYRPGIRTGPPMSGNVRIRRPGDEDT